MDGLTTANDPSSNWPAACKDSTHACNQPYNSCPHGGYCPQRYCEDIALLTELNIAYVRRVAHLWGEETKMLIGNDYYNAARQTVIDINQSYDCAGLRRPIIQAAILEHITSAVNFIPIPSYVISTFSDDDDFNQELYSGDVNFNSVRIAHPDGIGTPDINKIETRMWFYYLATTYIDFGYKALHMGNISIMLRNDIGNRKTNSLFEKIRAYAKQNNSIVIIDAHTSEDIYLDNDGYTLLLDFNSAPIRPIETYSNVIGAACSDDYKTEIIKEQGDLYNKSTGGLSPQGCQYSETPYFVEFDHHTVHCGPLGENHSGTWCVWGYDEVNYYYQLSDDCKLSFIEYAYPKVREIDDRGFLQMPGRHGVGSWNIPNDKSIYRLHDYGAIKNGISNLLLPSNTINIIDSVFWEYVISDQHLFVFRNYSVKAANIDNSSIFSWHIKRPNDKWEEYTYGGSRIYRPIEEGTHTIFLRQDNLGLPANLNGSKTDSLDINVPYPPYQVIPLSLFNFDASENCFQSHKVKFENIESYNSDYLITDLKSLESNSDFPNIFTALQKEKPTVYPNPSSNFLYIDLKDFADVKSEVSILDVLGRKVLSTKIKALSTRPVSINLANISSGLYSVTINQEEFQISRKILIRE